jgi:hypothetical protein
MDLGPALLLERLRLLPESMPQHQSSRLQSQTFLPLSVL